MNKDRICCELMRSQLLFKCAEHLEPHDCPDILVVYNPRFDEFGMPIRDGGSSSVSMQYCPWCGKKLPGSKRDAWLDELAKRGFDEPSEQVIPEEFNSDAWWR